MNFFNGSLEGVCEKAPQKHLSSRILLFCKQIKFPCYVGPVFTPFLEFALYIPY